MITDKDGDAETYMAIDKMQRAPRDDDEDDDGGVSSDQEKPHDGVSRLRRSARLDSSFTALHKINIFRVRFFLFVARARAMIEITLPRLCFPSFSRYVTAPRRRAVFLEPLARAMQVEKQRERKREKARVRARGRVSRLSLELTTSDIRDCY